MKRARLGLLLAAMTALGVGCDNKAKDCNEFYKVAAPIISSVAVPAGAPTGSAAVAWASDGWKHYERLAEEAGKIAERASDANLKFALENEKQAAADVADQLKKLAEAAASMKGSEIPSIKGALFRAAQAEQAAARSLEMYCTE